MSSTTPSAPEAKSASPSILPTYKPTAPKTTFLSAPINLSHTSYILLICCLITGILDSTIFHAFGTFVSGQTGNTMLFGLGASTAHNTTHPYRWAKSLIAIISFAWGCATFSHITRALGRLKRGTMMLSFTVQAAIVLLVAIIIQADVIEGRLHQLTVTHDIDWRQCMAIALLSFQSAGQIVASRALGIIEIPTVVVTSMLHDIATDPRLLAPLWREHSRRNQMLGAFAAVLVGALAGGFVSIGSGRVQSSLWLVGGLKVGIVGAWAVWAEELGEEGR